jgi:hypothetical protein
MPISVTVVRGMSGSLSGNVLCDALVRPGRVVVRLILGEDGAQVRVAEDQRRVEDFAAQVAARRSQIAFIRSAWPALIRILVPTA